MSKLNHNFYEQMLINRVQLSNLLLTDSAFEHIPKDWSVLITDIKGSTAAVMSGSSETVNYIATGSIVTILNLAFKANISVPFFFGGDGATFILPPVLTALAKNKLVTYQENVLKNFGLELRVGVISVQSLYEQGQEIKLSKFGLSPFFSIPVVLGNGLNYAEKIIKGEDYFLGLDNEEKEELDLDGMQCRWDKIGAPGSLNEILTLLVIVTDVNLQPISFSKVINHLDQIYGEIKDRQPISIEKLKLNSTFDRIKTEMRNKIGEIKLFSVFKTWFTTLIGKVYFLTAPGKRYLNRLVEMSDTLVLDGKINTVISGNEQQRIKLIKALDQLENKGELIYGYHVSNASIMSCYVRDMKNDHIHFVDGAEGGYTKAASMLKGKLKKLKVES